MAWEYRSGTYWGLGSVKLLAALAAILAAILLPLSMRAQQSPCTLSLTISAQSPSCANLPDGSIEIIPTDGTPPYTYFWNTRDSEKRIDQLKAGEYRVKVVDSEGCSSIETVLLLSPSPIRLKAEKSLPGCGDRESGSVTVNVTGGNPPYNFRWAHGPTSSGLAGLEVGDYEVVVSDKRGCEEKLKVPLPKAAEISVDNSKVRRVSQPGAGDGEIDLFVSGGRAPYTFLWLHNQENVPHLAHLEAGLYKVLIADATRCQQSFHFDLTYSAPLQALAGVGSNSINGNSTYYERSQHSKQGGYAIDDVVIDLESIYWNYGSKVLQNAARQELDRLSTLMNRYPEMAVEIHSHTDARSTAEYNMRLSQARADAVKNYLVSKGVADHRINAIGYGEEQLLNDCFDGVPCTKEQHLHNRRTTFKVTYFNNDLFSSNRQDINPNAELKEKLETELKQINPHSEEAIVLVPTADAENKHTLSRIRDYTEEEATAAKESVWWETGNAYAVYIGEEHNLEKLDLEALRKIGPLQYEEWEDGKVYFVLGYFTTAEEVKTAFEKVKKLGASTSHIISYKDGKRSK